ncbi:MAG: AcrR family transcriptional regulator [Candidatus Azotimanducaceae bacterium]|jgi:AcrR family transcriptional regulator
MSHAIKGGHLMPKLVGKPKNADISFSDRKLEVLRAAARLFNRNGYHNTTMDDVAAALSVTKPALYYYAKNKDGLLYDVVTSTNADTEKMLRAINSSSQTGAEMLSAFFSYWLEVVTSDFGRCLVKASSNQLDSETQKKNIGARRHTQDSVMAFVQLGIDDGSLRPCDTKLTVLALFDLFNGVAHWFDPTGPLTLKQVFTSHWQLLKTGLVNESGDRRTVRQASD